MKIQRIESSAREVLGLMTTDDDREFCKTLERPWKNNERQVSCIPAGTYTCQRRRSNHFQCDVFEITHVPTRSDVLIHPANYVSELLGCVALGTSFADLNGDGVTDLAASRDAFTRFMAMMEGVNSFTLTIADVQPAAA